MEFFLFSHTITELLNMFENGSNRIVRAEIAVKGIPASPGIAIGPVFVYTEPTYDPAPRVVDKREVADETERFKKAIEDSTGYLQKLRRDTLLKYGQEFAEILDIQLSILDDNIFLGEVEQLIRHEQYDAPYATSKIFDTKKERFLKLSDEYFRDRAFDVQSVKRLILKQLMGEKVDLQLRASSIIVADDLSPADTIRLHHRHILGFCTNSGGKNSHTAIVARSLGVPAVVGLDYITNLVQTGDNIILDGNEGIILANPGQHSIEEYTAKQKNFLIISNSLLNQAARPATTTDNKTISVLANIEFVQELDQIKKNGAEGIGLYRTEGLFLSGNGLPSEEEQTAVYTQIATALPDKPVVIRTLDVGGDKVLPALNQFHEQNPFLGWRAIRFCLDHKEIFIPQLKAILRANIHGNIKILLPMISTIREIHEFRKVLSVTKNLLKSEGSKIQSDVDIGIMVEVPSTAIMAHQFAKHVDFFSIGTNDLVQYTMAVDRGNKKIAHLYSHYDPALLQLIKSVIDAGGNAGIPVSMCGEMAGDPYAVPLLLGMGLQSFSASQILIPEVKHIIRNVSIKKCAALYEKVQKYDTRLEIQKACEDFYAKHFTEKLSINEQSLNE